MGHGGLKLPFLGSKTAFLRSEIADFEAILAFKTPFFTNFLPYWPYMMMGHVGGPPWYLYKGPGSLNMSLMAIFLNPRWSKIGQISQNHGFLCSCGSEKAEN